MHILQAKRATIQNSTFINNSGLSGGAFLINDITEAIISNNVFDGNKAEKVLGTPIYINTDQY